MRTSARSLARLVRGDKRVGRCDPVPVTRLVATMTSVRQGTGATVTVQAGDDKGKARQVLQDQAGGEAHRGQTRRGVSAISSSCCHGLQPPPSMWNRRTGLIATAQTSLLLKQAFHTASSIYDSARPASARSKGSASASSSTTPPLPPPSPSPYSPASLAGLGTTQLSPDIMLRCTIFDSTGSATSTSGVFKKSRLCSDHGLEPRDLRKIDSRVPNLVPTILARRGGILVNILHIRAMIKKDKVLLFDSYGSTDSQLHSAFVYNLQHNLRPLHHQHQQQQQQQHGSASSGSGGGLAYEFRALESILVSVLDALRIELGVVRGWTSGVLEELDDDVDREKLRTLLQVSRKLNAFLSRSKAVKNAVVEVLENDEDMQLMYLSSAPPSTASSASSSSAPSSGPNASSMDRSSSTSAEATSDAQAMDELELLLESFDKQVEEVVAETTQLHSDITNTQEVVELILDNNRNKLLALDLKTSIATMGISAGTLWAGLFGMNLKSHMEELDWAFAVVSGVAFGAVVLTAGVGLRRLERLRKVGLGMGRKVEERKRRKDGWLDRLRGKKRMDSSAGKGVLPTPSGALYPQQHQPVGYQHAFGGVPMGYMPNMYQPPPPGWTAHAGNPPQPFSPHGEPPQQQTASWWPNPFHPNTAGSPASDDAQSDGVARQSQPTSPPSSTATAATAAAAAAAQNVNAGADATDTTAGATLGMGLGSKWDSSTSSGAAGKKRRAKTGM